MNNYIDKNQIILSKDRLDFIKNLPIKEQFLDFEQSIARYINKKLTFKDKFKKYAFQKMGKRTTWEETNELIDPQKIKNVLVFRYDAIGDYIVSNSLFSLLKELNPNINIDVVSSYRNDFLIKNDPNVRKTFAIHPSKGFNFSWLKLIKETQKNDYDIIFGLVFTNMTKCAYLASRIAPNAVKISILHPERRELYGYVFEKQTYHKPWLEHYSQTMLNTILFNFKHNCSNLVSDPYLFFEQKAFNKIKEFVLKNKLNYNLLESSKVLNKNEIVNDFQNYGSSFCIINISAFSFNRQWKKENCIDLILSLIKLRPDLKIFVTGTGKSQKDVKNIVSQLNTNQVESLFISLNEFICLLAGAEFVVSPDTATVHICAVLKIKLIALYAESVKVAEWYPLYDNYVINLSKDPFSINEIKNDEILESMNLLKIFNK